MEKHPPEKAIIFIPGNYGSALKKKTTGERVWLTVSEGLWGSSTLALDQDGLEISGTMELIEDGILGNVRVVPLVYVVDVYASLLENLEDRFQGKARIIPFSYDWRQDNFKAVTQLAQLVDQLIDSGIRSISILAHSMGGLIATYYLRYGEQKPETTTELPEENWNGAQKIDRVVLAGVPFRGAMSRFQHTQTGTRFGLNKSLLTAQAISSLPATYQLLPFFETSKILSQTLKPIPNVIFDPHQWIQHGWGLMNAQEVRPQALENRKKFTIRELKRADRFFQLINLPSRQTERVPTQVLHICGKGRPTLAKAILLRDPEENTGRLLFDEHGLRNSIPELTADLLLEEGDGSLTLESTSLPQALQENFQGVSFTETKTGHADMLKDREVQQGVFAFLEE